MASEPLTKHRLASEVYGIDFAARLSTGEVLDAGTVAPTVIVTTKDGRDYTDVSGQFAIASIQISGTEVRFRLGPAAADADQQGGKYFLRITVDTDLLDHLVSTHILTVSERADVAAVP